MRIIKLIVILLIMMVGAAFAVMNAEPVQFNYYFGNTQLPLSLILVAALSVGAVLGILAGLSMLFGIKRENAELRRKSRLASQELNNLRALPIKEK